MRIARTTLAAVLVISLGSSAAYCAVLTPTQAVKCCRSMSCGSHGHHASDCCKIMASGAQTVLGLPAAAAGHSLSLVATVLTPFAWNQLLDAGASLSPRDHSPPPALSPPALSLRI